MTAFLDLVERRVSPHDNDMLHCFQSVLHDRRSGDDGDALDEIWRAASTVIAELDQSGGVSEDNTGRQEPAVVDQARSEQSFSFNSESQATQIAYSWNSHNDDDAGCAVDVTSAPTLAPVVARFDDRLMDPGRIPGEGPYTDLDVIPHWVARRGSLDASSGDPVAATVFGVGPLPSRQRRTAKPRHSGY